MKNYHCCATCIHFEVYKENNKTIRCCSRLGFETKPDHQFRCWDPKEKVKRLMKKN
ncbi:hypothetical protein [Bacillus sp. FJAT-45350]|uniref:hypothetical protein n=1 Tax=Bacillus sp. FJAT-45350 TaxID=2011014 RepID=UPI0015C85508|nr:hypothetical protein [Bacillus sp. FJAT-45350]